MPGERHGRDSRDRRRVRPISQVSLNSMATRMISASSRPNLPHPLAGLLLQPRHQDGDEHDIVDAEHDLERAQRQERQPRRADRTEGPSCTSLPSCCATRRRHDIDPDHAKPDRDQRFRRHVGGRRDHRQHRPHRPRRRCSMPAPFDAQRMDERKRHKRQQPATADDQRHAQPRRRREQNQIERDGVPERRKAAEIIVRRSSSCGRRNRARWTRRSRSPAGMASDVGSSPALRDRKGRHEHIGQKVDDEIERVARPARQHSGHRIPPRQRPIDAHRPAARAPSQQTSPTSALDCRQQRQQAPERRPTRSACGRRRRPRQVDDGIESLFAALANPRVERDRNMTGGY